MGLHPAAPHCCPPTFYPHPHVLKGSSSTKTTDTLTCRLPFPRCSPLGDSPLPTTFRFMFSFASLPIGVLIVIKLLLSLRNFSLYQGQGKYLKTQQHLSLGCFTQNFQAGKLAERLLQGHGAHIQRLPRPCFWIWHRVYQLEGKVWI